MARGKRKFEHSMIQKPGRRLMHKVPLRFVQNKVSGGGARSVNTSLALIPLIDFFVVVVLFLLMSFSASGEIPVDKNTKLPSAENTLDMIDAPVVAITGTNILVDGSPAGSTRPIEDSGRLQKIDDLHNILKNKRELWKQLNPKAESPGVVVMQVDHRVSALVVKSVFQTAAFAGYPNVSFMVGQLPKTKKGGEH
ncbi:MAG TPA: biopolymer transporter ExbD [Polyangiaceae bacterium]|nr:MAG: Biopolymer transport protein ExbD/TolR [Deltaproteobacteria bacterium ADurb.Bin207]HPB95975.1 biopolymer transporter ExbD [Polyangiaceae bacterium]HPY17661.1 biopolymer transporter ExbD [Polyangiaceae bacterium]HQB42157.1 biopolymer transporter ExbD [Polyangiaceae bacterium]HQM10187.1 biopolymer transporter ExbD [Polyangiaceae bacterium]